MDSFLITCLLYIPLSLGFAAIVAEKNDKLFLFKLVIVAWIILFPITFIFNEIIPFAEGGDDLNYFYSSNLNNSSNTDIFDIAKFTGMMAQPGYSFLLTLINFISEHNLLTFKLLNLCFLIIIGLTWYRIGVLLESPDFGRKNLICILLLTPLWYYVFFLLKDMTIALLQSLFLLGVVQFWRRNTTSSWLLIGGSIFLVLYFRIYLVLQDVLIVLSVLFLKLYGRRRAENSFLQILLGFLVCMGLLVLGGDQQFLFSNGITSDTHVLTIDNINRYSQDESALNIPKFLVSYLLTETAGLSPQTWKAFDSSLIRGVLAIPWIFVIVPFFLVGVSWILHPVNNVYISKGFTDKFRSSRFVNTPWGGLLIFVISMLLISFRTGDSTRWRLSDMPVISTIALAGILSTEINIRKHIYFIWVVVLSSLFVLFYFFK